MVANWTKNLHTLQTEDKVGNIQPDDSWTAEVHKRPKLIEGTNVTDMETSNTSYN